MRRVERPVFLGLAALAVLCALITLTWPPGFDHGLYAWVADVVVRGGMPYRDAWDMHGPLVPYVFAVPQLLFGRQFWAVRLLDLIVLAAATVALYRLVRLLCGAPVARWTALLFTLFYFSLGFDDIAQPDGWVAFVLLVVVERLLRRPGVPPARELLLFGLVVGLGALVKPFFAAFASLPLLYVVGQTRAARPLLMSTALVAAGAIAPPLVMIGWLAASGALSAFTEVHLRYALGVYAVKSGSLVYTRAFGVARFLGGFPVVALALPAVLVGAVVVLRLRPVATLLLAWLAIAVGVVALQDKFWTYHWLIAVPPLAVLGAIGIGRSLGFDRGALHSVSKMDSASASSAAASPRTTDGGAMLALALLALIVVHVSIQPARATLRGVRYAVGLYPSPRYLASFELGSFSPLGYREAARWISANTDPEAQLAMYTRTAGVAYLSERETAFRLGGWRFPVTHGAGRPAWHRYRAEYLRDLERTRPEIVLVQEEDPQLAALPPAAMPLLSDFPELAAFLEANYDRAHAAGTLAVFRRRAGPAVKS
ncbi:MAG TPA: glycosyltransferase family 39 protein [Longimicrobiales bacterium]|nr:glycosyltransferase family 39 protein [Longimicrobiales bacterium]